MDNERISVLDEIKRLQPGDEIYYETTYQDGIAKVEWVDVTDAGTEDEDVCIGLDDEEITMITGGEYAGKVFRQSYDGADR
ncbi:MAG: hypothetical protein PHY23_00390 [Oscillospiraceae bacterium]|nr:hypothetical protein [Oscillospiraceae bacterium]